MSRYDKYEPYSGGTRALLAEDFVDPKDFNKAIGFGLNAAGLAVKGAGNSGIVGIVCLGEKFYAGDVIDIMTDGDIVDFKPYKASDSTETDATPGTKYYIQDDGSVNTTNTGKYAGVTVEGKNGFHRLVVRVQAG